MSDIDEDPKLLDAGSLLILALSHEIANFRPGFRGTLSHTYILRPAASSMFCLKVTRSRCYFGVPETLFPLFLDTPWYYLGYRVGKPDLFLVLMQGEEGNTRNSALAVRQSSRRVRLLSAFEHISIVPMNDAGVATVDDSAFSLPLKRLESLEWEYQ